MALSLLPELCSRERFNAFEVSSNFDFCFSTFLTLAKLFRFSNREMTFLMRVLRMRQDN